MDPILSREELDALLGSRPNDAASAGNGRLLTALQVTMKSLQSMVDALGVWTAADLKSGAWEDLTALYELAPNTSFLLVEARVPGGSLYVLTSTATACRLDETAAVALETVADESAFIGWRRVVEYMFSDFCLALLPQESDLAFSPRTLPPRRWSPNNYGYSAASAHELLITTRLWPQDDLENAVYLLLPANTLREISGDQFFVTDEEPAQEQRDTEPDDTMIDTAAEREYVRDGEHSEERISSAASPNGTGSASPNLDLSPLADIPLYIAALCDTDKLPVRTVATWRPGMQVPIEFKAGVSAQLFVNGKSFAYGRLVCDASGRLLVEITAIQSEREETTHGYAAT
ncbi:MAG TPA: hypothetical protein GXZ82_06200 [Firmicutes bacterium]|nr:hypothetical protein [Bacillota bacterium]